MNQRRVEKRKTQKPKPRVHGKQYPGAHGKVVDWVEHKFEQGILFFMDVQFVDKTALSWSVGSGIVIKEAHLADSKTGDLKLLKRFVQHKSDGKCWWRTACGPQSISQLSSENLPSRQFPDNGNQFPDISLIPPCSDLRLQALLLLPNV